MKKLLSIILIVLLTAGVGLTYCSCGKSDDKAVYFLNFKPESADVYKKIAKDYEKETGVKLKVVTAAANTYEQTLKNEIAKSDPPTIFQINGPIGFDSWREYCADLTDTAFYNLLNDKSLAVSENGRVYAVPYVVEGYGIIYNDEIMQKYFALPEKVTTLTSASEINSFEKLKAVAEDMTRLKDKLGIKGVFASTSLSSGEDWRWQTHLANLPLYREFREKHPERDTVLAMLDAKEVDFKYAENYKNLFDLYLNNSVTEKTLLGSKSVNDSMAEFALGQCAMVQNGNWSWSQIKDVEGNTVKEQNIKMMPLYMGIENEENMGLNIGTENYFAINKKVSEEKQKQALDFLVWLFTSDTGKSYVTKELGFTTPFSGFSENELPADPLAKEVARYIADGTKENVPWSFVAFPSEKFKKDFGNSLLLYAQGNKEFDHVVDTVKKKWQSER